MAPEHRGVDGVSQPDSTSTGVAISTLRGWRRILLTDAWLAMLAGVATLSLLPDNNPAVAFVSPVWADLVHVPVYAMLTLLTILLVAARMRVSLRVLAVIVLSMSLFGGLMEILQLWSGRTASALDVFWNSLGSVIAAWVYRAWAARQPAVAHTNRKHHP